MTVPSPQELLEEVVKTTEYARLLAWCIAESRHRRSVCVAPYSRHCLEVVAVARAFKEKGWTVEPYDDKENYRTYLQIYVSW